MKCCGVQLNGKNRGWDCNNEGRFTVRGKLYCHVHFVTASREPARFRQAIEAWVRGEARREKARRAAENASRQIDAFPAGTEGAIQ
jgi:hypothetical protein